MTNEELAARVADELSWDPRVDSQAVGVAANNGTVTLRGTVASFWQLREAQKAAQRVHGVVFVDNELDVRILSEHRRKDAHLRRDVLQALMLDARIPSTVDAEVADGTVTLTGAVTWQYQRDAAEMLAGNLRGVTAVRNEISVASPIPGPRDVKDAITTALQRTAKLEADDIGVETMNGTVRLNGTVGSWWEHDAVLAAAWAAPGVTDVHDHISVRY